MNDIADLKKDQRKLASKKRLSLSISINFNKLIFENILIQCDWFKKSEVIASFLSIKTEISTKSLNEFIEKSNKLLCLPVIRLGINGKLIFKKYSIGDDLIKGKYGVREPLNKKTYLPDVIFTPCLAFDNNGFRLGYGGGYYDKTISYLNSLNHNFTTVGFAYDDQRVKSVVHDNLDQKLNYILTEKQLYNFL